MELKELKELSAERAEAEGSLRELKVAEGS